MNPMRLVLHAVGYPVAIVVIARLGPVFRERRTRWFVAEEAATAAIVAGWAIEGRTPAVVINALWGFSLALMWHIRRPKTPPQRESTSTTAT